MTEDGTRTLRSEFFSEDCHSTAGAWEETLYNYISGTEVLTKLKDTPTLNIFEVGFATGIGLMATLEKIKEKITTPKEILFVSSELDELLAKHSLKALRDDGLILDIREENQILKATLSLGIHRGEVWVLLGDLRKSFPNFQKVHPEVKFDCFYHDPFSPKKNPTLWTKEFFIELSNSAKRDSILGTYSSTKAVWKALIEAGWVVKEVKGYGKKKLSTRAYLKGETSDFVREQCLRSPTPALSDSGLP